MVLQLLACEMTGGMLSPSLAFHIKRFNTIDISYKIHIFILRIQTSLVRLTVRCEKLMKKFRTCDNHRSQYTSRGGFRGGSVGSAEPLHPLTPSTHTHTFDSKFHFDGKFWINLINLDTVFTPNIYTPFS